jgi:hypothetical protein
VKKRHRAHFYRDAFTLGVDYDDPGVGDGCLPDDLSREQLPRAPRLLGRND